MSTGGGWQDQIGINGGLNLGSSNRLVDNPNVTVTVRPVQTPDGFLQEFLNHCVFIYTGTTRLAKNLLTVNI